MVDRRDDAPSKTPVDKARQGWTPGIVRYVLAISLTLVIVGFVLSWVFA